MHTALKFLAGLIFVAAVVLQPDNALAASPDNVMHVQYGDTLLSIAAHYGTTVDALMRANKLPSANFVYAGQWLVIPRSADSAASPPTRSERGSYVVQSGDTLYSIAVRSGTSVEMLMRTNQLESSLVYAGQRLVIPGIAQPTTAQPTRSPAPLARSASNPPTHGKWIDVDISKQTVTAYEGTTPLKTVIVSTGLPKTPTVVGRFAIYVKLTSQTMTGGSKFSGDYYYLPNVPWVMYFYQGYAIHGTYWHNNFGRPMSRGCVNLTIADAKWFFDWAPVGTPVITHN
ncbi:MAG: LysM peptidoglycan-binding domain-containing protein [Chloroflexi bacterium]|nr:LysM peptidoglycan-binding domain-containing protein [Chloroflexota bacterium]